MSGHTPWAEVKARRVAAARQWICHHDGAPFSAEQTSWWHVEGSGTAPENQRQHVFCSEEHADAGCQIEHPA